MDKFGVQLFSYTSDCDLNLLERVKVSGELGFSLVELAGGYDDLPVEDFKKALADAGVKALSAHVGLDKLDEQLPYLAELGVKYMIVPMAKFNCKAEAIELANDLNTFGKKAAAYGIKTGYHNHTEEFYVDEGKYLMDWLIENTDPETVVIELDCGWVSAAGVDPVEYINKHKGRVAAIHIKENGAVTGVDGKPQSRYDNTPKYNITKDENGNPIFPPELIAMWEEHQKLNVPQGTGIVDWKAVKAAADAQWDGEVIYVVEREGSYNEPKDRVACLKDDVKWIKENL